MLVSVEHGLFRKTGSHPRIKSGAGFFRTMLFSLSMVFFGKPVPTPGSSPGGGLFADHAVFVEHDLFGKPVTTFPDHAVKKQRPDAYARPLSRNTAHGASQIQEVDGAASMRGGADVITSFPSSSSFSSS